MPVGVFGKLPARRDYVRHGVEPRLMQLIDPWLQRVVAESRQALGEAWLDNYLLAPIWRFWLGARLAGRPVLGALMPSVDGIGRYFPLCLLGAFDHVPPPELDDQPEWFGAVEALMLGALAEGGSYDALLAGIGTLPPPRSAPVSPEGDTGTVPAPLSPDSDLAAPASEPGQPIAARGQEAPGQARGSAARGSTRAGIGGAFATLRQAEAGAGASYHHCTYWWVPSRDGAMPHRALIRRGMPLPADYAAMIVPDGLPALSPALGDAG